MKDMTKGLEYWILILAIGLALFGLGSIFAQDYLTMLFGTKPFEPVFIRVSGGLDLGLAYLLYKAYTIKRLELVKPVVETLLVSQFLLTVLGLYNWNYVGVFETQAYITWCATWGIGFLITFALYRKQQ